MSILPGSTLGILGGGQLGRMIAMAARTLGYRVAVMDPDPHCACAPVADFFLTASFEDAAAVEELAHRCDVMTLEIEKVSLEGLTRAAQHVPVRPGRGVLEVIQDRGTQKAWLHQHGFPMGLVAEVHDAASLEQIATRVGLPMIVKRTRGGYDGRGQARLAGPQDAQEVFASLGEAPCVAEVMLDLALELSVAVARRPSGQVEVFPPAVNHHVNGILEHSQLPGPLPEGVADRARAIATGIAEALGLEGLLTVEFFYTRQGELFVNELAPRPHNSYHGSETACVTSQFEQLVRAVCDLPLGSTETVRPTAILNLLGDLWARGEPAWEKALALPGVRLHLYGKHGPRPGRKMGHLSASASTPEAALAQLQAAYRLLEA